MSDARVVTDAALLGVCDQLSDDALSALERAAADDATDAPPESVLDELTSVGQGLLSGLFSHEEGRLQVLDAVELERHERHGGG